MARVKVTHYLKWRFPLGPKKYHSLKCLTAESVVQAIFEMNMDQKFDYILNNFYFKGEKA